MLRQITDELCRDMGRPLTLIREGEANQNFTGVVRGIRPEDLVGSAQQGDMLVVMPAAQITGRAPTKFDRVDAAGRILTVQFVRECYDGPELASYKATVRG